MQATEELKLLGIAIGDTVAWLEFKKGKRKVRSGRLLKVEGRMGIVEVGQREVKVSVSNLRPYVGDKS